jgi:uncharacterized Zn-finger protein
MVAIEYDGEARHNSENRIKNDEKKNIICDKAGIRLIRIREPHLPMLDNCVVIVRSDTTTSESLNQAIISVFEHLGLHSPNVDTDSDSGHILDQYATKKYENSLSYCFPEIASEWHPTKNGNMNPERISKGSTKTVWWLGKCGHAWQMRVSERTRKTRIAMNGKTIKAQGCPYCSGKRILVGFNDLKSQFPDIASEWHPEKNGTLTPETVFAKSGKNVWWKCQNGHEWPAKIYARTKETSCPYCSGKKKYRQIN